ncbi:MAG: hypothetical protein DHS20C15_19370 [Planctomycetota bacterium]|nr:MAG: hypothetical protein DHS20C15_19370 [Planctomycetota bacterium]
MRTLFTRLAPQGFWFGVIALACVSCGDDRSAPALPFASALPIRFEVTQRDSAMIPETGDALFVTLGDITDGQVHTTLVRNPTLKRGQLGAVAPVLGTQSLRTSDLLTFHFDDVPLQLALTELDTSLLGDDVAHFVLEAGGTSVEQAHLRVDALIARLGSQSDVTFLRNGDTHTAREAADHLRRKFDHAREEIRSVDDFIELCGTRSSMSGEAYAVRLADREERPAADYLRALAATGEL